MAGMCELKKCSEECYGMCLETPGCGSPCPGCSNDWECGSSNYCVTPGTAGFCVSDQPPAGTGAGVSEVDAVPPKESVVAAESVTQSDAVVWIEGPWSTKADGSSLIEVTATVTDADGNRVVGQQVRFVEGGFGQNDGNWMIYGGLDGFELGSYYVLASLGYKLDNGWFSNQITVVTGDDGTATVEAKVPSWSDYFLDKPQKVGVWFDVDGGWNPYASMLLCYIQP